MRNRIGDKLYTVRVPVVCTLSPAELDLFGVPVTEDLAGRNREQSMDMTIVKLPLRQIVEIYSTGMSIRLVDSEEIATLYHELEEMLIRQGNPNTVLNAPKEDIGVSKVELDRFAEEVFNLNKVSIVNDATTMHNSFNLGAKLLDSDKVTNFVEGSKTQRTTRYGNIVKNFIKQNPSAEDMFIEPTKVDVDKVVRKSAIIKKYNIRD